MTKILLRSDFPLIDFALNVKKKKQTPVRSSGLMIKLSGHEEKRLISLILFTRGFGNYHVVQFFGRVQCVGLMPTVMLMGS